MYVDHAAEHESRVAEGHLVDEHALQMRLGLPDPRGRTTFADGTAVNPLQSNSSSPAGQSVEVKTMSSRTSIVTMLSTNSLVARMFRTVSLTPVELTMTCGGSAATALKNECGAMLRTPSADRLEIQAIGLGMTRAVNRW